MSFGAPRHVVSLKCHTPSRRMLIGASRQVGHWTISGCLRDKCRLVHPVRLFIRYIDSIQDIRNLPIHLQFDLSFTFIRFSNITFQFHIHFHIVLSRIYSTYVLISYTHSHTHFIYSFMYSFHILFHILIHGYLVNYQNT